MVLLARLGTSFVHPARYPEKAMTSRATMVSDLNEMVNALDRVMMSPTSPLQLALPRLGERMPTSSIMEREHDIVETTDSFKIITDFPGYSKDNIDISISGKQVTITATKESELKEDTDKYHRFGRYFGKSMKVVSLPDNVNEKDTSAEFVNGVLTVTFSKMGETDTSRKIEIKEN